MDKADKLKNMERVQRWEHLDLLRPGLMEAERRPHGKEEQSSQEQSQAAEEEAGR